MSMRERKTTVVELQKQYNAIVQETQRQIEKGRTAAGVGADRGTDHLPHDMEFVEPILLEGVPVIKEVKVFAEALLNTYKNYKIGFSSKLQHHWEPHGNYSTFYEAWVYVPGERYARGRIGYGEFRTSQSGCVYMVYNHAIKNHKYRPDRLEYNTFMTTDFSKALKNAYKYLKPYSISDVALMERDAIYDGLRFMLSSKKDEVHSLIRAGLDHDKLLDELRTLVKSGYKFASQQFNDQLVSYFEKKDEYDKLEAKRHKAYYVLVHGDETEIVECADVCRYSTQDVKTLSSQRLKTSDVPVDIAGKVAVISMVGDGCYVEGVGAKVSADAFWVECE